MGVDLTHAALIRTKIAGSRHRRLPHTVRGLTAARKEDGVEPTALPLRAAAVAGAAAAARLPRWRRCPGLPPAVGRRTATTATAPASGPARAWTTQRGSICTSTSTNSNSNVLRGAGTKRVVARASARCAVVVVVVVGERGGLGARQGVRRVRRPLPGLRPLRRRQGSAEVAVVVVVPWRVQRGTHERRSVARCGKM